MKETDFKLVCAYYSNYVIKYGYADINGNYIVECSYNYNEANIELKRYLNKIRINKLKSLL